MNKNLLLTSLLLTTISISSAAMAKAPSWNNIGLGYINVDIDDTDYEPSGFVLSGSHLLNDNVYVHASYQSAEDDLFGDDLEISTLNLGLGYRHSLNATTDLFGQVSYLNAEAEYSGQSEDENGYSLAIGVKSMLIDNLEGGISATRVSLDGESETAINVGLSYFINDQFSIGAGYSFADDAKTLAVGVKVHF
jgi:opacity protein-like surface antigen